MKRWAGVVLAVIVLLGIPAVANATTHLNWTRDTTNLSREECMTRAWDVLDRNELGPSDRNVDLSTQPEWVVTNSNPIYVATIMCLTVHHVVIVVVAGSEDTTDLSNRLRVPFLNT